jgi:A/G-specific adenine glycosylase
MNRFQKRVWDFYNKNKRSDLPWRKKITPYRIWVSEIMLQQTQVDRVILFFNNWMKLFPSITKLANVPQAEILRAWKGLGYNSRALRMQETAKQGGLPKTYDEFLKLPGIGPYTAGAICAFAYNQPVVMIETNIRRVFIHEFFKDKENIHDRDILKLIEKHLDKENPREWYWALMDYGAYLGKTVPNPNKRSRHYTVQKKFKGSDREIRGVILRVLLERKRVTLQKLFEQLKKLSDDQERVEGVLEKLEKEGFLEVGDNKVWLKK